MTHDRTAGTTAAPSVPSPLIALLALAALLVGLFVIHSEATGHDMHQSMSSSAAQQMPADESMSETALASGTHDGLLNCALLAMTCVLLLTLAVAIIFSQRPANYRRLLDAGGAALGVTWRRVELPIHHPSLIQLSISRV